MENEGNEDKKLGLLLLVMLIVGSIIGGGIFNSPTDLINLANPMAVLLAWLVGGFGIFMMVLVYLNLSNKKPELKGGIYSYAREGFGRYVGFNSAWGYWIGAFLGNVAFLALIFKTLNSLLGPKYQLNSVAVFIAGSALLWFYHFLITRGIKDASILNAVITIAKIVPLVLVIVFGFAVFSTGNFSVQNWTTNLAATGAKTSLPDQIAAAMTTILWCFSGIEAAVVMSTRAKSAKLVGKSTVISFLIIFVLYLLISVISMGVVPAKELANSSTPLADVLNKTVLGSVGAVIVKVGLIVSLLGVLISWIMLVAEVQYVSAKDGVMPKWFTKENKAGVPVNSLIFSNGATQLFLLFLLMPQLQAAYSLVYTLGTAVMLIPYLLVSSYLLKLSICEKYKVSILVISILATIYNLYTIYAVGVKYLIGAAILYAIGIIPFYLAKKEADTKMSNGEKIGAALIIVIGVAGCISVATGALKI